MIARHKLWLLVLLLLLAGCDLPTVPRPSPTPRVEEIEVTDNPTQTASVPTGSPTASVMPQLVPPTSTFTPGPPTETFTPTPTLGPYEYVIQPNDTLIYIIQLPPWSYDNFSVIPEILRMNPNITSVDRLPGPGSIIYIPRPTDTPTPEGFELTVAADPAVLATQRPTQEAQITQVAVQEGITMIGIAQEYETTLRRLSELNPDIPFISCDFSNPSGGEGCSVPLQIGQLVNVPAPTPTPTLSPTFSGSETPTPTPTYAPPSIIFPPNNAVVRGGTFQLQWLSSGMLASGEVYLIQIEDTATGVTHTDVTRATSYPLPASLIPADGQPHAMRWRVGVAVQNEEGYYRFISTEPPWLVFEWRTS